MKERAGESFSVLQPGETDVAIIAAALSRYFADSDLRTTGVEDVTLTPWRRAARLEGVRR